MLAGRWLDWDTGRAPHPPRILRGFPPPSSVRLLHLLRGLDSVTVICTCVTMLRRRLGAILLFALLLLVDDARCDSDGLPVTAPTSLQPGKQATFGWE